MGTTDKDLLIADKDQSILDILSIMFKSEGYCLECCRSGREAIPKIASRSFGLVLSDTLLPDIDGQRLLVEIKKAHRQAKVVMMSIDPYDHSQFELLGALDFVGKPLSRRQLVATLDSVRKERRSSRRFPLQVPVVVNRQVPGTSVNFSSDGILFTSDKPFTLSSRVEVAINPLGTPAIRAVGQVVRAASTGSLYLTALYFLENISRDILANMTVFNNLM